MSALFDPSRHEPLFPVPWSESRARHWIGEIADDAHRRFSDDVLWPTHPLDLDGRPASSPLTMLYFGAAGVVWALDALARAGLASERDWSPLMPSLAERNRREVERMQCGIESLLMGQAGVALLDYRLSPDDVRADRVALSIARNATHPSNELMWGVSGTLHAALAMQEATRERRWGELFAAGAASLYASLESADDGSLRLWTQQLYGGTPRYLGAGHGFAGNASAIVRGLALLDEGARNAWTDVIVDTLLATARVEGAFANWPAWHASGARAPAMLVQWCHGAPGIIACVGRLGDSRLDATLAAAAELTWHAGGVAKGASLCHGTAGNGFAFLKLYRRTGESRWLERARAFAMHAIAQSDRDRARYGMRRYSLWTGDPGVALYVAACIGADDAMPMFDPDAHGVASASAR